MKLNKKILVSIILLLVLAFFLRVYNLDKIYTFGADEEYQTNIAMSLVRDFHIIWIGVSAANTGFYLGPYWSYFTAFLLYLSHGDPISTAYAAAALGTITTAAMLYVGWKMFSPRVGIVAAALYACLPLIVFFDQKYWNPSAVPLLAITMIYSLYRSTYNQKYWLVFAVAYGLIFHTHLSLLPFILIALYQLRHGIRKNILIQSVLLFLLTILPLIFFDYFHNFSNITTPLRFGEFGSASHASIFEKGQSLLASIARLWYISPFPVAGSEILPACSAYRSSPSAFSVPFILLVVLFLFKKAFWINEKSRLILMGIGLFFWGYLFYPGRSDEYYLLGLFPLLVFIPGIIWHKYLSPVVVFLACLLGVTSILTATNPYGLAAKKIIISQVMDEIGDKPYELTEAGGCHRYEGWRYLFATYARRPERSSSDASFSWLYPAEISNTPVDYSVIITGNDTRPSGFSSQVVKSR